jgi:L,D-transpeptidase YbiS
LPSINSSLGKTLKERFYLINSIRDVQSEIYIFQIVDMRLLQSIGMFTALMAFLGQGCFEDPAREALQNDIKSLQQSVDRLERENRSVWRQIQRLTGTEPYLVIDTEANWLYVRRDDEVLLKTMISTGSGKKLEEQGGRKWTFTTPKGVFTVLRKEENPIWYKPDWAFVEDNLPIPPPSSPKRFVRGMLGKYALSIGGSYKIHGTPYRKLLGQSVSHGCIRVGDEDMERLYHLVSEGTTVYIY